MQVPWTQLHFPFQVRQCPDWPSAGQPPRTIKRVIAVSNHFQDSPDNVGRVTDSPQSLAPLTDEEKQLALFAHLGGILAGFVVPLIIWLIKKDTSRFVDDQGKEALNFQLTVLIACLVASAITVATCGIGFPLLFVPIILAVVYSIIAGIAASRGEWYRYPSWTIIRMIN